MELIWIHCRQCVAPHKTVDTHQSYGIYVLEVQSKLFTDRLSCTLGVVLISMHANVLN